MLIIEDVFYREIETSQGIPGYLRILPARINVNEVKVQSKMLVRQQGLIEEAAIRVQNSSLFKIVPLKFCPSPLFAHLWYRNPVGSNIFTEIVVRIS